MSTSIDIRNSAFGICPVPPKGNANFAWVQHFIHHLAARDVADFGPEHADTFRRRSGVNFLPGFALSSGQHLFRP